MSRRGEVREVEVREVGKVRRGLVGVFRGSEVVGDGKRMER